MSNKHYYSEMEDIYRSYEFVIRERLTQLDTLARKMCSDMGAAGIGHAKYTHFIQQKVKELAAEIIREGDEENGSHKNRRSRTKRKRPNPDL